MGRKSEARLPVGLGVGSERMLMAPSVSAGRRELRVTPNGPRRLRGAMELAFTNLLIVAAVGLAAPLALGFAPAVRIPSIVVEIVVGIVVGPAVLGWVHVDDPVQVFATFGLAYLLFLAGLEIDFDRLR